MVNTSSRVVFRVDAGVHIGAGHVMRCLSLATALRAFGSESLFVCRAHDGHLAALIEAQGHPVHLLPRMPDAPRDWLGADWPTDAEQTLHAIDGLAPDWLVVDHYGIDSRWEARVGAAAQRRLVIDDLADRPHDADLLLDQNLQPGPARYAERLPARTRTLLGPRFALLRPQFARLRAARRLPRGQGLQRLLAFAGGSDSTDLLSKVARAWQDLPASRRPRLDLVVGRDSQNLSRLRDLAAGLPDCTLHVQTAEMAALIAAADLMVTAGGSVNWERCCLGVPALVCETAANQHDNVHELSRARTAIALGRAEVLDEATLAAWLARLAARPSMLCRLGERAGRLVDGDGARRVALAMHAHRLALRRASAADAEPAWAWRNAESTRRHFTNPAPIALADHLGWWQSTLADPERALLVAEIVHTPVGVLRLDRRGEAATVSIYLDPQLTGLGLGAQMLLAAKAWAGRELPRVRRLLAVIHPDNRASTTAFAAAGFRAGGEHWTCEV